MHHPYHPRDFPRPRSTLTLTFSGHRNRDALPRPDPRSAFANPLPSVTHSLAAAAVGQSHRAIARSTSRKSDAERLRLTIARALRALAVSHRLPRPRNSRPVRPIRGNWIWPIQWPPTPSRSLFQNQRNAAVPRRHSPIATRHQSSISRQWNPTTLRFPSATLPLPHPLLVQMSAQALHRPPLLC